MPNPTTYSQTTNTVPVSIEGRAETNTLHIRGHVDTAGNEQTLSPAGLAAVVATLSTYWSGLTGAKLSALVASNNGRLVHASGPSVTAAVLAADHSTVAASLATNVKTSGNVTRG